MLNVSQALDVYTKTRTVTASPLDLVIMLYEGAIEFLDKAAIAINMKEVQTKIKYLDRTMKIIEELLYSLNLEAGGEIAINLQDLYIYMMRELTLANLKNDAEKVRHVEYLLKELLSAWKAIR